MSRIGKVPVVIPEGVDIAIEDQKVVAKGPRGELSFIVNEEVLVEMKEGSVKISPQNDSKSARSKWGMSRTMISNIVAGVKDGFEKRLEINGVGYRAAMQGRDVRLALGFSHDVIYKTPEGVTVACPKPTELIVSGIDKQKVGQVAAEIRGYRPPEPYKGKGVKYADEVIFRKEGKKK